MSRILIVRSIITSISGSSGMLRTVLGKTVIHTDSSKPYAFTAIGEKKKASQTSANLLILLVGLEGLEPSAN